MVSLTPDHHLGFCQNALRRINLRGQADPGDGLARARTPATLSRSPQDRCPATALPGILELLSAIVYADRKASQARRQMAFEELGRKVKQVKPRFSEATIPRNLNELARDVMLVTSSAHE